MFYVYTLADPRDGTVFYVGKGCRGRLDQHEKEARCGVHSRKCERIRQIEVAGQSIVKVRIAQFEDEQEAYDFETEEIARIGLANLTNVMPGGQRAWLDRQRLAAERKAKKDSALAEKGKAWLKGWLKVAETWKRPTFPGMRNGDQEAVEFIALVRKMVSA